MKRHVSGQLHTTRRTNSYFSCASCQHFKFTFCTFLTGSQRPSGAGMGDKLKEQHLPYSRFSLLLGNSRVTFGFQVKENRRDRGGVRDLTVM